MAQHMLFDEQTQANVDSWLKETRSIRKTIANMSFSDVAAYCVAKREDTIKLFMEMSQFLEDNIDMFLPDDAKEGNVNTPVNVYASGDYIHVWIDDGIKFLLHVPSTRVLWVTHEQGKKTYNYDLDGIHYHFFTFWDKGRYPKNGYETYLKSPTFESYFGELPSNLQWCFDIKDKVDEDWRNANICKDCIKKAIVAISDCEKALLSKIKEVKASVNSDTRLET